VTPDRLNPGHGTLETQTYRDLGAAGTMSDLRRPAEGSSHWATSGLAVDPSWEIAGRVHAELAPRVTFAETHMVVTECLRDLDVPSGEALPELAYRLARQRLTGESPRP